MEFVRLSDTVLVGRMVIGLLSNNVYAVTDGKSLVVVDPTSRPEDIARAVKDAADYGLVPREVPDGILLTHYHFDHVGAAAALREMWQVPVYASAADADSICGAEEMQAVHRRVDPCPVDVRIEDGDVVSVGTLEFRALLTPGHSPGSMCFLLTPEDAPERPLLISGDTLFNGTYGRVDFPDGDADAMRASLVRLSALPGETQVFPGHGEATSIAGEQRLFGRAKAGML